ncbi:hypothetical protein [Streptomyces diastatochromogenes]|uniref:hypothetical protein n=1 Tax=Streptomyces diastatochromogenes TaxID=42236 RepID=UPI0036A864C7
MAEKHLGCEGAATLFYEPDGLLLRCCLIPVDGEHRQHLLTFQLGYLGPGEITVSVALDGGLEGALETGAESGVLLRGTGGVDGMAWTRHRMEPSVHLSYVTLVDEQVSCRYTVWGQAAGLEDGPRGELATVVTGRLPDLTATTTARVTRLAIPASRLPEDDVECGSNGRGACPGRPSARASQFGDRALSLSRPV